MSRFNRPRRSSSTVSSSSGMRPSAWRSSRPSSARERLRPSTGRCAQFAAQEADDAVREVAGAGVRLEVVGVYSGGERVQGEVAYHLARGCDLYQMAQQFVAAGVEVLYLFEAPGEPLVD